MKSLRPRNCELTVSSGSCGSKSETRLEANAVLTALATARVVGSEGEESLDLAVGGGPEKRRWRATVPGGLF